MKNISRILLKLEVIFLLLFSACAALPVAPTVTPANTVRPTKTATPTKMPFSYEVPLMDNGVIDEAKITNVVSDDPIERQEMYREVKEQLLLQTSDSTKIGCDTSRYIKSAIPATSLELLCFSLTPSGNIVPHFVARDSRENVVLTFLVYFRNEAYEFMVPQLLNLRLIEEEMDKAIQDNPRYPAAVMSGRSWGFGNSMWVWFAGNLNPVHEAGQYPQMEETSRVLAHEGFEDSYWVNFILEFNTDTVIFAAYGVIYTWVDSPSP